MLTSVREWALTLAPTVETSSPHENQERAMVTFHDDVTDNGPKNRTPPSTANNRVPPSGPPGAPQENGDPCPAPPAQGDVGANAPEEGVWVPPTETEAYLAWKRE